MLKNYFYEFYYLFLKVVQEPLHNYLGCVNLFDTRYKYEGKIWLLEVIR